MSFTSSNPAVATVLPNGLVTGITKGEATIVVTTDEGGFTASCRVKVGEIAVSEVKLNKRTLIIDIGEKEANLITEMPTNQFTIRAYAKTSMGTSYGEMVIVTFD